MTDIPADDSSCRDDEFPLHDTYDDDQGTPKLICPFCTGVDLEDVTWHCLSCGLVFQEDEPDVW